MEKLKKFMAKVFNSRVLNMVLALLLIMVLVQPSIEVKNSRVVITLGPPEAFAAGTADYSLGTNGTANNITINTALAALPTQGGLLHFKVGSYNVSGIVTRAIGNVTIEGEGLGTYFFRDAANPIFQAGGNNWVFKDFATDTLNAINLGATTGWMQTNIDLGGTYYSYRSATGNAALNDAIVTTLTSTNASITNFTNSPVPSSNATLSWGSSIKRWLTGWFVNLVATTVNTTNINATTANITTLNTPTGRGATYVIAASDSNITAQNQADIVVTGTAEDEINNALSKYKNVLLLTGTYTVNRTAGQTYALKLTMDGGRLSGEGANSTIILASSANCNALEIANIGGWEVDHLNFEGNNVTQNSSSNGIAYFGFNTIAGIHDNSIQNFKGWGIYPASSPSPQVRVNNNSVHDNNLGQIYAQTDVLVHDNIVYGYPGVVPIGIEFASGTSVTENYIFGCTKALVNDVGLNAQVQNNKIQLVPSGWGIYGIGAGTIYDSSYTNNQFRLDSGSAIAFYFHPNVVKGIIITGNMYMPQSGNITPYDIGNISASGSNHNIFVGGNYGDNLVNNPTNLINDGSFELAGSANWTKTASTNLTLATPPLVAGLPQASKDGSKIVCLNVTGAGTYSSITQNLTNYARYKGGEITVAFWYFVPTSQYHAQQVVAYDGVNYAVLSLSTTNAWVYETLTFPIASNSTGIQLYFYANSSGVDHTADTIYLDAVMVVEGYTVPSTFSPKPLTGDY
jgi:hypothetical protein